MKEIISNAGLITRKSLWARLWCLHSWVLEYNNYLFYSANKDLYTCRNCGKQKWYRNMPISWIG